MNRARYALVNTSLFCVLMLAFMLSISLGGYYRVPLTEAVKAVVGGRPLEGGLAAVLDMRLRRALTAAAVGAMLGISSVALQNVLRNPLASPFTLGIQHAAALGAGVAMMGLGAATVLGPRSAASSTLIVTNYYAMILSAFVSSSIQGLLILALAAFTGLSVYGIILASIALSFAAQAALSLLQYLFFNEVQVAALLFWTFGDVGRTTWFEVWILLAAAAAGLSVFLLLSTDLDLLIFGDEVALSSGVNARAVRFFAVLFSALLSAVSVSLVGVIGFAGLVASHAARLTVGWSSRRCIPTSALYGALVVVLADLLGRTALNPVTLPVGVTTTLVGVPLLLALLIGGRRGVAESRWG